MVKTHTWTSEEIVSEFQSDADVYGPFLGGFAEFLRKLLLVVDLSEYYLDVTHSTLHIYCSIEAASSIPRAFLSICPQGDPNFYLVELAYLYNDGDSIYTFIERRRGPVEEADATLRYFVERLNHHNSNLDKIPEICI